MVIAHACLYFLLKRASLQRTPILSSSPKRRVHARARANSCVLKLPSHVCGPLLSFSSLLFSYLCVSIFFTSSHPSFLLRLSSSWSFLFPFQIFVPLSFSPHLFPHYLCGSTLILLIVLVICLFAIIFVIIFIIALTYISPSYRITRCCKCLICISVCLSRNKGTNECPLALTQGRFTQCMFTEGMFTEGMFTEGKFSVHPYVHVRRRISGHLWSLFVCCAEIGKHTFFHWSILVEVNICSVHLSCQHHINIMPLFSNKYNNTTLPRYHATMLQSIFPFSLFSPSPKC